ncbi:hypothetical protein SHKM778_59780 [Streptomyces sp. KM77-8]|uniref:Sensor domain-containing protein n=1 Tax=Streptomyces haneummycinicus TaxID=3074435 RepID=A0AAT9HPX8_9ACTN
MPRLLRPFGRTVTYTRLLHLFIAIVWPSLWLFVEEVWWIWALAAVTLLPAGLIPAMRTVEGLQARLLLTGQRHDSDSAGIVVAPSASWSDRGRLVVWLLVRLLIGCATSVFVANLLIAAVDLGAAALGGDAASGELFLLEGHEWWHVLLLPVVLVIMAATVVGSGRLITALAHRLLGPSPPSGWPPWRNAPSSSWSARVSPASSTTPSVTR